MKLKSKEDRTFARPDDPDPPPFSSTGIPTIRDRVDDALYYPTKHPKRCPKGQHEWKPHPIYELRRCDKCKRTVPRKRCKLVKLLPLFKDRVFPPTDRWGRYYETCIVNSKLKLVASWYTPPSHGWTFQRFQLFVRFPKAWLWTTSFTEFQFDKIIRAVDPLLQDLDDYDPKAVFLAAQRSIYGERYGTGGLNLDRLMEAT